MRTRIKRCLSLFAACLLLPAFPVSAASEEYSVSVQSGKVSFLLGGAATGSYAAASTDLILTSDRSGELFVQFPNNKGTYTNITLGQQKNLSISGSMKSLTLRSALPEDVAVTLEAGAKASDLIVYSKNLVTVGGAAGLVDVYGNATIDIPSQGGATRVRLRSSSSTLTAAGTVTALEKVSGAAVSGAGVQKTTAILHTGDNSWARSNSGLILDHTNTSTSTNDRLRSDSGTTSTSGSGLTVKATAIYAEYGDLLEDLEGDLESAVRVYNRSGNRVYGDLSWVSDGATKVRDSQYYRFSFWPDDSRYDDEIIGRVKITVEDEDDDSDRRSVYFEIEPIYTTSSDDLRLRDLEDDLNASITAYSRTNDDTLDGVFKWVSSGNRVRTTGYHQFTFTPDNSRYRKTTGRIRVYID